MKDDEPPPTPNPPRAVLKFGGEVVGDRDALDVVLREVAALAREGWRFVIVHGGGPQSTAHAAALGVDVRKVAGRRVTDAETLRIAKQVLAGELNTDVVAAARTNAVAAVGLAGVSVLTATRRPPERVDAELVDYGFVGAVASVDVDLLETLWASGRTPVIAPLGVDTAGQVYNINADTVAAGVAGALAADHLMLITGIGGVMRDKDDPSTRIPRLTAAQARAEIARGTIVGGMIPKIEEALRNLAAGIGAVHILPPGAGVIAAAAEQPGRFGTVLVAAEIAGQDGALGA